MGEYLATGFAGLDRVADPAAYVSCLRLLGEFPEVAAYKRESVERLGLLPGARALEVGCGLGVEATAMARLAAPGGLVVALDASSCMLGRLDAGDALPEGGRPRPVAGDAARLPFVDGSFDACRVERTLQHVADPGAALAEMARVVRPGGRVVAVEPDWGTFVVDSGRRQTTRTLTEFWCDSFKSGWVGRGLARLMAEAGLSEVAAWPRPFILRKLSEAEAVYNLFATADRAVAAGRLSQDDASSFKEEQRARDAAGRFFAALTFFMVIGVRPEQVG